MSNRPSLVALRAFEAAARHGNFSVAAAELHQTPSAVSHQIKSLEGFFGFPLFIRHSRHLELNNQGRRLFNVIQPAFNADVEIFLVLGPSLRRRSFQYIVRQVSQVNGLAHGYQIFSPNIPSSQSSYHRALRQ